MKKIMIVEDEYIVRVGIKSYIDWESHGYRIIGEASDGRDAIKKIEIEKPDIMLTDLKMDGMDGLALIRYCQEHYPDIKIIVLSNLDDGKNVKEAMKAGALDYVFKLTSKPEELLKILDGIDFQENKNAAEVLVRKNMSAIRQQIIKKAAVRSSPYVSEIEQELKALNLSVNFNKDYCIVLFSFSKYIPDENESLLQCALENIMQEVVNEYCTAETFAFSDISILSVVQLSGDEMNTFEDNIRKAYDRIYEYAKMYFGLELCASISDPLCGIASFPDAVSECQKAVNRMPSDGKRIYRCVGDIHQDMINALDYVSDNLSRNLSVKEVADRIHMSESYFSHLFKKEMGVSFVEYVNEKKIRYAEKLLATTDCKIGEISQMIGIDNTNYFSILFRKKRGITPNEYREKQKSNMKSKKKK